MDGVQRWLDRLGLGQLAAVFADQQIDLDVLTELTDEDLEKLCIPLGPRKKLLRAIAEIRDGESPSGSSASTRSAESVDAERRQLTGEKLALDLQPDRRRCPSQPLSRESSAPAAHPRSWRARPT